MRSSSVTSFCFFFQAEDGIRDYKVTGVQTCALPIYKFLEHRRYAKIFEEPYKKLWASHQNRRDLSKVLRIGYVSGDFCDHALRFFIEPVLKNHNHDRFEIHCYNTNRSEEHTSELQSPCNLVCRLLLEKKKKT